MGLPNDDICMTSTSRWVGGSGIDDTMMTSHPEVGKVLKRCVNGKSCVYKWLKKPDGIRVYPFDGQGLPGQTERYKRRAAGAL